MAKVAGEGDEGTAASDRTGPTKRSAIRCKVNGKEVSVPRSPERTLLQALRVDLGLTGTKYGCGEGQCGACMVLLGGQPVRSCQVSVREVEGLEVQTIEGLARAGGLNPAQRAFAELGAFQCGFCTPGMIISTTALLERVPDPSEAEVREALEGNLCRCCGHARILRAVGRASVLLREESRGHP